MKAPMGNMFSNLDLSRYGYIRQNYEALLEQLTTHAQRTGRAPATVVAVTKSGTDEELYALCRFGAEDIGENRPQELVRRHALLENAGLSVRMHEIGNLQTNKVKSVLGVAHLIHSVGSVRLAEEISRQATAAAITVPVLMEVNCAAEESKGGFLLAEGLSAYETLSELPGLSLLGLMTMGPVLEDPEGYRPYFRATRSLFETLGERFGYATDSPVLSMGMSDSYMTAIEEGATLIRVGRRLFINHPL